MWESGEMFRFVRVMGCSVLESDGQFSVCKGDEVFSIGER